MAVQDNRTILITGCSSGIGLATAERMRAGGWRVFATARKPEDLDRLAAAGFDVVVLELSDSASIEAAAGSFLAQTQGYDLALFNNAAYGQPGAVEDITAAALRRQIEVNLIGTHDLTRRIIPAMRARRFGRIVNCSSVLGFIGAPFRGAYCASKFALEGLTDAMRLELRGSGISVALIEPGPIHSRFVENALAAARANVDIRGSVHRDRYETLIEAMLGGGTQTFKLGPEVVAGQVAHACQSRFPRRRYKSTLPTHIAGVLKRVLPDRVMDWVVGRS